MASNSPGEIINAFLANTFSRELWQEHSIEIISYVFAPILLLFLLFFAVFSKIKLFGEDRKVSAAISFLLVLFALISGLFNQLAVLISSIGSIFIVIIFFFIIGAFISKYFKKRAENFAFFLGSRYLTKFFAYSPVLIILSFALIFLISSRIFGISLSDFRSIIFTVAFAHVLIFLILVGKYRKDFFWILLITGMSISILFPEIIGLKRHAEVLYAVSVAILIYNLILAFPKTIERINLKNN